MVLDCERRGLGRVQDIDFIGNDFNVPGRNLAVLVASFGYLAFNLHHEFPAQGTGFGAQVGIGFHIEYDLGDAVAVPQVHEGHASQVAGTLHPAAEADFFSDVRNPEFAVGMCPVHFLIELMSDTRMALNQADAIRCDSCRFGLGLWVLSVYFLALPWLATASIKALIFSGSPKNSSLIRFISSSNSKR